MPQRPWSREEIIVLLAYLDYCVENKWEKKRFDNTVVDFLRSQKGFARETTVRTVDSRLRRLWHDHHAYDSPGSGDVYSEGLKALDFDNRPPLVDETSITCADIRKVRKTIEKELKQQSQTAGTSVPTRYDQGKDSSMILRRFSRIENVSRKRKASVHDEGPERQVRLRISQKNRDETDTFTTTPPSLDDRYSLSCQSLPSVQEDTPNQEEKHKFLAASRQVAQSLRDYPRQGPVDNSHSQPGRRLSACSQSTRRLGHRGMNTSLMVPSTEADPRIDRAQSRTDQNRLLQELKELQSIQGQQHQSELAALRAQIETFMIELRTVREGHNQHSSRAALEKENVNLRNMVLKMQQAGPHILNEPQIRTSAEPLRIMHGVERILGDIDQIIALDYEGLVPDEVNATALVSESCGGDQLRLGLFNDKASNPPKQLSTQLADLAPNDLVRHVICTFLKVNVFESRWPEPSSEPVGVAELKLDKVYDIMNFHKGGASLVQAIDSVATGLTYNDPRFTATYIPRQAEKLAGRLCEPLQDFGCKLEDNETPATFASLKSVIRQSLELKISAMMGSDTYSIFFVRPGSKFQHHSMTTDSDAIGSGAASGATVGICHVPGLLHKSPQTLTAIVDSDIWRRSQLLRGGFEAVRSFSNIGGQANFCIKATVKVVRN